ncbi:DUF4878 domain-containing protein [Mycobacterium sp. NPDC050551]|uniref:Rv0361 family membrane protein n=1 Tax=Mycobacterium sp. NPDC050551 TaxID=3155407 RepID=UPI0034189AA6
MSNPPGPQRGEEPTEPTADAQEQIPTAESGESEPTPESAAETEVIDVQQADGGHEPATEAIAATPREPEPHDAEPEDAVLVPVEHDHEPATEVFASTSQPTDPQAESQAGERRFTAPSGFDAGTTQKIDSPQEPATEVFATSAAPAGGDSAGQPKAATPQLIPPRGEQPRPPQPTKKRSWGWVAAVVLVIAALAAIAILGTLLLTRGSDGGVSQEEQVRTTIQNYDTAMQKGDLATLRSITCGATRDSYVKYNDRTWADTHARVSAAKQYPVVASIDQVVVNGDHAEANVTTFMAFAPQTRSTRSFDLQFRDDQWKICQAPAN